MNYSKAPYAVQPWNTITYAECHDNHLLWDKLSISAKNATVNERIEMQKLALSIILTSQGISFLHAGTEFLRTKKGVENSFESPDSINAIDWSLKTKNKEIYRYIQALIKMRKEHPAFRMIDAKQIREFIKFGGNDEKGTISYIINGAGMNDKWKKVFVIFNGNKGKRICILPPGKWKMAIRDNDVVINPVVESKELFMQPYGCSVFYRE